MRRRRKHAVSLRVTAQNCISVMKHINDGALHPYRRFKVRKKYLVATTPGLHFFGPKFWFALFQGTLSRVSDCFVN
jgi:hypothetical protein